MTAEQAQLQLLRQPFRDRLGDEAAETGVDAVGVLARAVRGALDDRACRVHLVARVVGELGGRSLDRDAPDVLDTEIVAGQRRGCDHCGESSHAAWTPDRAVSDRAMTIPDTLIRGAVVSPRDTRSGRAPPGTRDLLPAAS